MLVTCTKTGLTYARKVHREGDVFILTGAIEREYKNLSVEAWARKQRKIYSGEVVFRQSTSEELIAAIKDKKIDPGSATVKGHLSKQQLRIALDYVGSKAAKRVAAIQALRDGLDEEIEDFPEEKAEVVKVPEKEVVEAPEEKEAEAPVEELELVEEPAEKAPEEAPEAPEEEPKAEESEKEPEASEEAPEKEPEAPPEEPVKKPGKKDKKKR